jgi:NAD(P)-dependent dehydrogenase (short-subunit alcohol dehydrogenase family)
MKEEIRVKDYWGYKGQKCVITGSSSGMGKATAEMLVDLGAEVYGIDVVEKETPGVKFIAANLSKKTDIDNAFSKLPDKFEKFFGIAGISGMQHDYVTTMTVNTVANRYITDKYLLQDKRLADNGAIVYCSSGGGWRWQRFQYEYMPLFMVRGTDFDGQVKALEEQQKTYDGQLVGPMAYVPSKRALTYFAKLIMREAIKRDIRVNNIGPGFVATGLEQDFKNLVGGTDEARKQALAKTMSRVARSEELAAVLVFMNSEMPTFCTGQYIFIAGGNEAEIELFGVPDGTGIPSLPVREYM